MKKIMGLLLVLYCLIHLSCSGTNGSDVTVLPTDDVNVLFTHRAGSGLFEDIGNGTYRLTLYNVDVSTGYSARQPELTSGSTSTKTVIEKYDWDPANPPTAAVVITDPAVPDTQDVMIVRLLKPVYNESSASLSFYVQLDSNYREPNLAPYLADADPSLPASFGQVNVVVDSFLPHQCSDGYIQCYRHYGCCSQPSVTQPLGSFKVHRCWSWSHVACIPCSEDPCKTHFPDECGGGTCYTSCLDDSSCWPQASSN